MIRRWRLVFSLVFAKLEEKKTPPNQVSFEIASLLPIILNKRHVGQKASKTNPTKAKTILVWLRTELPRPVTAAQSPCSLIFPLATCSPFLHPFPSLPPSLLLLSSSHDFLVSWKTTKQSSNCIDTYI